MYSKLLLLLALLFTSQAVKAIQLKSAISYDTRKVIRSKNFSKKVKIHVYDLKYPIPINKTKHNIYGYIEFDPNFLLNKRSLDTDFIDIDEISNLFSQEIEKTKLELELSQKYFFITNSDFSRSIDVRVLDFLDLNKKLLRCDFIALVEFPLELRTGYWVSKSFETTLKFKFKADEGNFFKKAKTTKFKLLLN